MSILVSNIDLITYKGIFGVKSLTSSHIIKWFEAKGIESRKIHRLLGHFNDIFYSLFV